MKEESTLRTIISVVVVIGAMLVASRLFNKTYTPPEKQTRASQSTLLAGKSRLPLTCTIVVSDTMRKSGSEIPALNVGAAPSELGLIRPVGEMLSGFLVDAGRNSFRDIQLVSRTTDAQGRDVIIELVNWRFGTNNKDTGYNFTGLPLLVASGEAYTTLHVEVQVSGQNFSPFVLRESAKGIRQLNLTLFPVSRLSRSMTESSDLAAESVCGKIIEKILSDGRVNEIVREKLQ